MTPAPPPVIALLTDFGLADTYVGQMKGVILSIAPTAQIIDLTHAVTAQQVVEGAFLLERALPYLPEGSVIVAVVDPGVGTARRAIALKRGPHRFVAPDNGLLTPVLASGRVEACVAIGNDDYLLPQRSSTFHGRDLFSPAAAHLAAGIPIEKLGNALEPESCMQLDMPGPARLNNGAAWRGAILFADHYGNLITSIEAATASPAEEWQIEAAGHRLPLSATYGDVEAGKPLAYVGSFGTVEIAIRNGSARERLKLEPGASVILSRRGV